MSKALNSPDFFIKPENWRRWRDSYGHNDVVIEGIEFQNIDFSGLDFSNVKFINCHVENCLFKSANLISADLSHSSFSGCDFNDAKLIAANLPYTKFTACSFKNANLLTAVLKATTFIDCELTDLDFQSFDLIGVTLDFCDLTGQNLGGKDLTNSSLKHANLTNANLAKTIFNNANLSSCAFKEANLDKTSFKLCDLSNVDFSKTNLSLINFANSDLRNCDFRYSDLSKACFFSCEITGAKLFDIQTDDWDIRGIKCQYAFWDAAGEIKTEYKNKQFEKIYVKSLVIELKYDHRLMSNEIATLPILIEHLQATHWGTIIRLKSIEDISGASLVKLIVDNSGKYEIKQLENSLLEESSRLHKATLALRSDRQIQRQLKEAVSEFKEAFWPRLLETAIEYEMGQEKNFCVLFIDLQGFSEWNEGVISERLSLFRGLLKPILERWNASYPNMEGDSLRATFHNPKSAVECAIMIRDVLSSADFQVRVGIDLGKISIVHNEITNLSDLEGSAVTMASRLESMAQINEILVSEKVKCYVEKETKNYLFSPQINKLTKNIGDKKTGDEINTYSLKRK